MFQIETRKRHKKAQKGEEEGFGISKLHPHPDATMFRISREGINTLLR